MFSSYLVQKIVNTRLLTSVLKILRYFVWIAISLNIAIEVAEVYLQKDVYHLALSAIFFLFAKLQIGISELLLSMNDKKSSRRLFYYSIFMICAAIIEIIDLGIDRVLTSLPAWNLPMRLSFFPYLNFYLALCQPSWQGIHLIDFSS